MDDNKQQPESQPEPQPESQLDSPSSLFVYIPDMNEYLKQYYPNASFIMVNARGLRESRWSRIKGLIIQTICCYC